MKKLLSFLVLSVLFASGCSSSTTTKPTQTDTKTQNVHNIAQIGDLNQLKSSSSETVIHLNWGDSIPSNVRFVVVDQNEKIDNQKKSEIQSLINQNKVVAFYGENVDPASLKEKTGIDIMPVAIGTNVSLNFYLYGYGYSNVAHNKIPLFYAGNVDKSEIASDVVDFLNKQETDF